MQQLGALGMGSVLEDGTALAPVNEISVLGDRNVERGGGQQSDAAGEGGDVGAVGLADECDRSSSAADPARSLSEKLLEPAIAVLPNAVVLKLAHGQIHFTNPRAKLTPSQTQGVQHRHR